MGLAELAVIAFIAVIAFGPDRLPDLARQAGSALRSLRRFAHSARDELRDQLGPEYADLELQDLDPRTLIRKQIAEVMADLDDDEVAQLRAGAASERDEGPTDPRTAGRGGRAARRGQEPLEADELPPYDVDAT